MRGLWRWAVGLRRAWYVILGSMGSESSHYQTGWLVGTAAWPGVPLSADDFQARALALGVSPKDLADHAADFFLSSACAVGMSRALRYLEDDFLMRLDRHLGHMNLSPEQIGEVRQDLRIKLLAGNNPRIATYAARAPLDAWIRVAAIRLALDRLAGTKSQLAVSNQALDQFLESVGLANDDQATRQSVRAVFQAALERSLASLPAREKALLRMFFMDGLNIDAIGVVFRVHRSTVGRWLVDLRRHLFDDIRAHINLQLSPSSSAYRSLVRLVEPVLHLSVERLLGASAREEGAEKANNAIE